MRACPRCRPLGPRADQIQAKVAEQQQQLQQTLRAQQLSAVDQGVANATHGDGGVPLIGLGEGLGHQEL